MRGQLGKSTGLPGSPPCLTLLRSKETRAVKLYMITVYSGASVSSGPAWKAMNVISQLPNRGGFRDANSPRPLPR